MNSLAAIRVLSKRIRQQRARIKELEILLEELRAQAPEAYAKAIFDTIDARAEVIRKRKKSGLYAMSRDREITVQVPLWALEMVVVVLRGDPLPTHKWRACTEKIESCASWVRAMSNLRHPKETKADAK